jgi:hypothetical protein
MCAAAGHGRTMLVFWKARLVFLAVPKTGSTALEAAFLPWADASFLNPPRLKHMTVRRYRRQLAGCSNRTAPDGTDGDHARAGGLAVELVSLPQPPGAGGQPQSTADIGFAAISWRPGCQRRCAGIRAVGRQSRFLSEEDRHARGGPPVPLRPDGRRGGVPGRQAWAPRPRWGGAMSRRATGQRSCRRRRWNAARRRGRGLRAVGQALRGVGRPEADAVSAAGARPWRSGPTG